MTISTPWTAPLSQETLDDIDREIAAMKADIADRQRALNARQSEREALRQYLASRPPPEITITDHAVVRYLERVQGIDIQAIRAAIVPDTTAAAIRLGAKSIRRGGYTYVVKDGAVVTVK